MVKDEYGFAPGQLPGNLPKYLRQSGEFRFARLELQGIDNTPVLSINNPAMAGEEICLLHRSFASGDDYLAHLHDAVRRALADHRELPVVRFADGEYAFYCGRLNCNGLYQQAESRTAIKKAFPAHIKALTILSNSGIIAPLIFPGNTGRQKQGSLRALPWLKKEISSASFLAFLQEHGITLSQTNYLPFYVVYAYLTSAYFARLVDGKKMCIINSDLNDAACRRWFERFASRPALASVHIPAEYVATRWEAMREGVLADIPPDVEICLVGAGVGALTVCVDVAERFSIPVLDAGHVLNMMNDRVDKSNGSRLFTLRSNEQGELEKHDA